jgi:hypothetical protein
VAVSISRCLIPSSLSSTHASAEWQTLMSTFTFRTTCRVWQASCPPCSFPRRRCSARHRLIHARRRVRPSLQLRTHFMRCTRPKRMHRPAHRHRQKYRCSIIPPSINPATAEEARALGRRAAHKSRGGEQRRESESACVR